MSEHHHSHHYDQTEPPSALVLRVQALESSLIDAGLVDPAAVDVLIDTTATKVGPRNGANVVAHAWSDSGFEQRRLSDAAATISFPGYTGRQAPI